jgi:hypothetical protein
VAQEQLIEALCAAAPAQDDLANFRLLRTSTYALLAELGRAAGVLALPR